MTPDKCPLTPSPFVGGRFPGSGDWKQMFGHGQTDQNGHMFELQLASGRPISVTYRATRQIGMTAIVTCIIYIQLVQNAYLIYLQQASID